VIGPITRSLTNGARRSTALFQPGSNFAMSGSGAPGGRCKFITCCPEGSARLMLDQSDCVARMRSALSRNVARSPRSSSGNVASACKVAMEPFSSVSTAVLIASVRASAPRRNVSRSS
jgi:hypothetical protein